MTLAFEMNQSMVEREFIKPMLKDILESVKEPEDLLSSWMKSISLERFSIHRVVSGKKKATLSKPRYSIIDETSYWQFQLYVEQMYKKSAEKYVKFGLLTQKSFIAEFGNVEYSKVIALGDDMTDESRLILERLGIIEISNRRLEFLKWLIKDIDLRDQRTGDADIESWL